jgi:hypothetical protein
VSNYSLKAATFERKFEMGAPSHAVESHPSLAEQISGERDSRLRKRNPRE